MAVLCAAGGHGFHILRRVPRGRDGVRGVCIPAGAAVQGIAVLRTGGRDDLFLVFMGMLRACRIGFLGNDFLRSGLLRDGDHGKIFFGILSALRGQSGDGKKGEEHGEGQKQG